VLKKNVKKKGSRDRGFKFRSDNHASVVLGSAGFTLLVRLVNSQLARLLPGLGDGTQLVWGMEIYGRRLEM